MNGVITAFSGNQLRQVPADRCVETDLTALDLMQNRGGGEGLGDAADAVSHVGGDGAASVDIGDPGGAAPDLVAVSHLGEQARHPCAVDVFDGCVQCRGIQWVRHVMHPFVFPEVSSSSVA
jgi:hypothetical protein